MKASSLPPAVSTAHIHFISPQQGVGSPLQRRHHADRRRHRACRGTKATTCTPGAWYLHRMLEASRGFPLNFGFLGKGNASSPRRWSNRLGRGRSGLKLHEDWGTTPAAIDTALTVADDYDVQVAIHTDTLNESGFVENTIAAFKGRTIHTYHSEGAGGGTRPIS